MSQLLLSETGIFNVSDVLDGSMHKHLGEISPILAQPRESIIAGLHVWDNVFSELWCERAYKYSNNEFEGTDGSSHIANKPWGVYVAIDDILVTSVTSEQLWQKAEVALANKAELFENAIAVEAIRSLLLSVDHDLRTIDGSPFDLSRSHGCAVWCLSSDEGASVDYHIDYAELFRYETGIIIPPLAAGTIQVLDVDSAMEGGEFMANSEGIAHYRKFGYKGNLAGEGVLATELAQGSGWVTVRFKRGRGILHCGLWPHLSLPVRKLGPGKRRVVLGLNLFPVFGPLNECCLRAPEHSRAFNRTVKLYQALNGMTAATSDQHEGEGADANSGGGEVEGIGKGSCCTSSGPSVASGQGVTASAFLKNKPLGRLLVMAARRLKEAKAKEG